MRLRACLRAAIPLLLLGIGTLGVLWAQKPFRAYQNLEHNDFALPPDYNVPAEFTRARLKYHAYGTVHLGEMAGSPLAWTIDYPMTDRHVLEGLRRLTRLNTKSVEQVVELDNSDDIYNWPFLYVVEPGHWTLNDEEADQMREYLLKGGFLMTDDFHGTMEWEIFMDGLRKVFPDRPPIDIDNKDPIFHTVYDLKDRFQIPGLQWVYTGSRYEYDGFEAKWRAVYDEKGRVLVGICHNMDMGDAIEWSDDPRYPEKEASLAYRVAVNYVMYDLTH